jgi:hypothetical protein
MRNFLIFHSFTQNKFPVSFQNGTDRASSIHGTQSEAWKEARRLARGAESEAFLKGRDGSIRARNTYRHDPFPPKG